MDHKLRTILLNTRYVLERLEHTDARNVNCKACQLYQDVIAALKEDEAKDSKRQ